MAEVDQFMKDMGGKIHAKIEKKLRLYFNVSNDDIRKLPIICLINWDADYRRRRRWKCITGLRYCTISHMIKPDSIFVPELSLRIKRTQK